MAAQTSNTTNRKGVFYPKTETPLSDEELSNLKNRYDYFDAETELGRIVEFVFGKRLQTFSRIYAWGLDHLLFKVILEDGAAYLVRINNTSVGDDYFEVEALVYKTLKKRKIQNCNVYHVEKRSEGNFPYDFMIIDFLEDGDLEKLLEEGRYSRIEELELVRQSGVLLRKIHSIKTQKFGFFRVDKAKEGTLVGELDSWRDYFYTALEDNLRMSVDLGLVDRSIVVRAEKIYGKHEYFLENVKPVLLHGDFCDHIMTLIG